MRLDRRLALLLLPWTLICAEAWVRWLDLDQKIVVHSFLFQESDTGVQQVSQDPVLHYALAPGSQLVGTSPWHDQVQVHINQHGARGPERDLEKPADTTRILFFGGSTTFGSGVQDHETLPARLEEELPGTEVWNFGTPAYVPAQMARLARQKLNEIPGVDMVVLLPTNRGRRAFLGGPGALERDYSFFFENDPFLVAENVPPPNILPAALHLWLHRFSATWRWSMTWWQQEQLAHVHTNPATLQLEKLEVEALEATLAESSIPLYWAQWPPDEDRHPSPTATAFHARRLAADLQVPAP